MLKAKKKNDGQKRKSVYDLNMTHPCLIESSDGNVVCVTIPKNPFNPDESLYDNEIDGVVICYSGKERHTSLSTKLVAINLQEWYPFIGVMELTNE